MTKPKFPTIKALVFDFIHRNQGRVAYAALEQTVLREFPESAFKRTHWAWYRYQCTKGRFATEFSASERGNILGGMRTRGKPSSQARQSAQGPKRARLQAVSVTAEMLAAVQRAIKAALAYENATVGTRKMGITAEVGEVLACHELGLRLCIDPRSEGFDAVDDRRRRVEIKSRRSETRSLPKSAGRTSTFSQHRFDYALLVILDQEYRLAEIWRADYQVVSPLINKQKRRNPSLSAFKKLAKRIWPRG